ncbi:hypothetical protein [Brevibacterium album]|uniref:hypothetical protein n=1 Tax=Brevibacterium album TaxID=417948 RepID=UPI0004185489|nr:hypothetical protein [Brevibacterium album]
MALKIIGAVGVKVRPEAKNFRDEAERDLRKQMGDRDYSVPMKVRPELDRSRVRQDFEKHKQMMRRELERIEDEVRPTKVRIDHRQAKKDFDQIRSDSARVRKALEGDIRQAIGHQKNLSRELENERTIREGLRKEIAKQTSGAKGREAVLRLQKEINRSARREYDIVQDLVDARKAEGELRETLSKQGIRYAEKERQALAEVRSELHRLRQGRNERLGLSPATNEHNRIEATLRDNARIEQEFKAHQERIRREAERTREAIDGKKATLNVDLDDGAARAQMMWLTRPRSVPIHVRVNTKSLLIAEGILRSMAGVNALSKMGTMLEGTLRNFDKFTLVTSMITAAVLNLTNAAIGGTAALFGIGKGLVQVMQGAAMAPTFIGAIATSMVVAATATAEFFSALSSGDFSNLSGNALKNAQMLEGSWTRLSDAIKDDFWSEAGTSMARFVNRALPTLERGLRQTAGSMGRLWSETFTGLEDALDLGYYDRMFDGLSGMMRELAGAARPAMRAIMQLGARGAEYLPRLGEWLREGAEGFERFIAEADAAGRIDQWIENSIQGLKDLGNVSKGTWNILEGFSTAALAAGAADLTAFGEAMVRWGDAVESAQGQFILGELFEGALQGLSRLGDGMGNFFSTLGDHISWIKEVEIAAGGIGGEIFNSLATIFDNERFRGGMLTALHDVEEAMRRLNPAFDSAAGLVGDLGRVAGAIFKGIAPTINSVVGLVSDVVGDLSGPLIDAIPRLTAGMGALVDLVGGGVRGASTAVAGLVDGFNALPGPIQSALLTAGGLFLMRNHIRAASDAVVGRMLPAYTQWGRAAREVQEAAAAQGRQISLLRGATTYFREEMAASATMARQQGQEISKTAQRFAAFDRITGTALYGVYEGSKRAQGGVRDLAGAVRSAASPMTTFARSSDAASSTVQRSFAQMYTSARNLATSLPAIGPLFTQLGTGIARDAERGRGGIQRLLQSLQDFDQRMSVIAGSSQFGTLNTQVGKMHEAGRRAGAGLRSIASGAGQAAAAIGATAATGLRSAATGLMGAMGGPWGLALTGAAVGIGVLAQQSSEANQRVKAFQSTLRTDGTASADTFALAAERAGEKTTSMGMSFWTAGETFYDVGRQIGVSSQTMTEAFAGNKDAIDSVRSSLDAWDASKNPVKAFFDGTNAAASALEGELKKVEKESDTARQNLLDMADATGVSTERVSALTQMWQGWGDSVRAGTITGQQMLSVLDTMTGSQIALQDASYNYQASLAQSKSVMSEWSKIHAGGISDIVSHFKDANATFDMTKQSQRDLYSILRQQVEPAFQRVAEAFNSVGGGAKGIEAARATMTGIREDMMSQLMQIEGMTEESAANILDSLNINPDAIELVLDENNLDEDIASIARSLEILTGRTNEIAIEATGLDPLQSDVAHAKDMLFALTSPMYLTKIGGEDALSPILDSATGKLNEMETEKLVEIVARDDASSVIEAVRSALDAGLNNEAYEVVLTAIDNASGIADDVADKLMSATVLGDYEAAIEILNEEGLHDAADKLADLDGTKATPEVDLDAGDAEDKTRSITEGLDEVNTFNALPTIGLNDEASPLLPGIGGLLEGIGSLNPFPTVDLNDQASPKAGHINDALAPFVGWAHSVTLGAIDQVTPTAAAAMSALGPVNGAVAMAHLMADNQASPEIEAAQSSAGEFDGQSFVGEMDVMDNATFQINAVMSLLQAVRMAQAPVTLTAIDAASPVISVVIGQLGALNGMRANAVITANAGPAMAAAAAARAALTAASRSSYQATLTANPGPAIAGAMAARTALTAAARARYQATISANPAPAISGARAATTAIRAVPDKTANVRANVSGLGAVQALRAAIASVRSKTVTVTVNRRGSTAMADGGLIEGGVQTFANGGINLGRVIDNRIRFMAENHTAQIAHAGAMRLWAEPETGGEAYIPLSESKRSRSEDILDQVATRFGGRYVRPGTQATETREGDVYNITLPTVERNAADEVAEDLTFHLKHMRRGGAAGGPI